MKSDKIVIYPNVLNFMNIGAVFMGTASLFLFFVSLTGIKFYDDERYPGIALLCLIMGILFLGSPLGKKITICDDVVDYRNWFFKHSKIRVTSETKIKMGCYRGRYAERNSNEKRGILRFYKCRNPLWGCYNRCHWRRFAS